MVTSATSGLRLRCPLESTVALKAVAPSGGYTAGQLVKIGDVVGIVAAATDAGDLAAVIIKAPKVLVDTATITSGQFAIGKAVYFNTTTQKATQATTGNYLAGHVIEAGVVGATTVMITLDGNQLL